MNSDDFPPLRPVAVVAGASEGIGQGLRPRAGERGVNLITFARRAELSRTTRSSYAHAWRGSQAGLHRLAAPDLAQRFDAATAGSMWACWSITPAYSSIGRFVDVPLADHLRPLDVNSVGRSRRAALGAVSSNAAWLHPG